MVPLILQMINTARVVELFSSGHTIFLTGKGGVGKSVVIHSTVKEHRSLKETAITAPTATGKACGLYSNDFLIKP